MHGTFPNFFEKKPIEQGEVTLFSMSGGWKSRGGWKVGGDKVLGGLLSQFPSRGEVGGPNPPLKKKMKRRKNNVGWKCEFKGKKSRSKKSQNEEKR